MSTRMITDELLINGMPCHKYILRGLGTTVDAIVFRKTYVNTMVAAGATYEEIEAALPLLSFKLDRNSPIAGYDFSSLPNQTHGLSLIDSIRLDDDVATYRTCDKFYKKFDKKAIACRLCPLSAKFSNRNIQVERSVLSYALSSPSALQYLLDNHVAAEHFTSVIDVMGYFSYPQKPSCYPLFAQTFLALQQPEIRADYFTAKENGVPSVEMIAYHDTNLTSGYIPRGLISPELTVRLEEVLSVELEKSPCPDKSKIDLLIFQLMNPTISLSNDSQAELFAVVNHSAEEQTAKGEAVKVNPTQIAEHSNMGLDTLDNFYDIPPSPRKSKSSAAKKRTRQKEAPTSTNLIDDTIFSPTVPLDTVENVTLSDLVEIVEPIAASDDLITNVAKEIEENDTTPNGNNPCFYERVQDTEVVNKLPGKSTTYSGVPDEQISITEIPDAEEIEAAFIHEGAGDNMIVLPVVPRKELTHFALCLDTENVRLLSMFESYVLKDRRLSIELIQTEEKAVYLLMYSPRMRAYLYTDFGSIMVKEILTPLLEHTSISKYCYFPYATISALWKVGVYVKGVYSLFSMSALLYGDHSMGMEVVLGKMGANAAIGGTTIKPCGEIKSIPLKYMHAYANVYHRSKHEINKRGFLSEYKARNHFDLVLGYSYYQDRIVKNGSTLFVLHTANGYRFQSSKVQAQEGNLMLCYTFQNSMQVSSQLIRDLLIRLDAAGRLRKWHISISGLSNNSCTLCIKETDYKSVATILNTTILAYLHEKELFGIEYHLESPH